LRGGVPCKYTSVKSITKKVISTRLLFFKNKQSLKDNKQKVTLLFCNYLYIILTVYIHTIGFFYFLLISFVHLHVTPLYLTLHMLHLYTCTTLPHPIGFINPLTVNKFIYRTCILLYTCVALYICILL
jgi:hypothetical protein